MASMNSKARLRLFFVFLILASPLSGQSVRERIRNSSGGKPAGASLSESQASDVTLTLNPVSVRPIQVWVRTAGKIDKTGKLLTAYVQSPEAAFVKVGQRVRAFPPESKSSMFQ